MTPIKIRIRDASEIREEIHELPGSNVYDWMRAAHKIINERNEGVDREDREVLLSVKPIKSS